MTRFVQLMSAPGVYLRMLVATVAFALTAYLHYESVTLTLYYSIICIFLMQIGYVGGVLFLIWRESHAKKKTKSCANKIVVSFPEGGEAGLRTHTLKD
ncbi:hypothetical protein QO004_003832 [Rhizobium mesoamericanum]|uniref:hypothetical protein n=1 Tax=Rhizobium mesoamericanum TaxID=1079800 RepID=UPI0027869F81|nr:hypothetical protein [Rhizobium mesoamericanum]MDQ0562031.1 hypothetical protein [Rhizobium mesoamericanum]